MQTCAQKTVTVAIATNRRSKKMVLLGNLEHVEVRFKRGRGPPDGASRAIIQKAALRQWSGLQECVFITQMTLLAQFARSANVGCECRLVATKH
jgi:hypothetical protein